jgi:hypothetical protein
MKALASKIILSIVLLITVVNTSELIIHSLMFVNANTIEMQNYEGDKPLITGIVTLPDIKSINVSVCSSSSSKTYMDYRTITSESSLQYLYTRYLMTIRNGFLYDKDGFIGVALGSYFGEIGTRYRITFSTGIVLNVIKIEEKADEHTDSLNCENLYDHSVIEFVIDTATIPYHVSSNGYIASGNFNNIDQFKGSIVKIEKLNT